MAFFKPHLKTKVHLLQLVLAVAVMSLCGVRIVMAEMPMMRTDMMALAAGGKTLVVIGYQLLTHHVQACHRLASLKANLILNILEILFWAAIAGMGVQLNMQACTGDPLLTSCLLSWIVAGTAAVICLLAMYSTGVSIVDIRDSRRNYRKEEFISLPNMNDDTSPLRPVPPIPSPIRNYSDDRYISRQY